MPSSPASPAPIHRRHTFRDAARFLEEYEANLRHGGWMAAWPGAPAMGARVSLTLDLPLGLGSVDTEGVVVFTSPTHAGLQLKLSAVARKALDAAAVRCKEPPVAPLPAPAASPPEPRSLGSTSIKTFSSTPRAFEPRASRHEPLRYVEDEIVAGVLPEPSIGSVLLLLGHRRATGRLDIETERDRAEIYLRAGSVLRVIEDPVRANRLGDLLVKSGRIRAADRDAALKDAARTGAPLGESLMRAGLLSAHALKAALATQLLARCYNQLKRRSGRFTFQAGATPPPGPSIPALSPGTVLFRAPYDHYQERRPDDMAATDAEFADRFLHRAPDAPDDLFALGISEEEQSFWGELVNGACTLREAYTRTPLPHRTAHALVFALVDRGFLLLESAPARPARAQPG